MDFDDELYDKCRQNHLDQQKDEKNRKEELKKEWKLVEKEASKGSSEAKN